MSINPVQGDDGELLEFVRQIVRDELSLARRIEKQAQGNGKQSAIDPRSLRRSAAEKSALIHKFYQESINIKFINDPVVADRRARFLDGLRFALEAIAAPHTNRPGHQWHWGERPKQIMLRARDANWNI